ncbi:catalase [Actinokineospora auranticolor]|uniref:Catalase n=1 Tax=Actinokineospora auranticolor TaxID=155976 RepID=A0A2S6GIE1_9PSEU|nr:catalase [Actinokineospora auranticolor]PPK64977.1 catalase [Actinokineospora auranticolor]
MDSFNPAKVVKDAVEKAVEKVADLVTPPVPGAPGSKPPAIDPPTEPQGPLPRKADQSSPETRTATGAETGAEPRAREQHGEYLTTSTGVRLHDTDHSLKAGERGPTLLQDHHLREKITHFDHERIPERVVHARGAGVHGVFVGYGNAQGVCKAAFLAEGVSTPVFVRFSTVVGSRGSADTVRDTRGFATKFYTSEGNFDLVGNNIPVFFIQDGIKFPDIIHAAKPHPDREIPQAQSAHDTFWDFVSLHTEATHHVLWQMSDRAVPRSYRMMEGFGVHTFRLVNADGETALAKFHWKPKLGVHSLLWEEAQLISGVDPDFHRRDLFDAIEAGAFPQWELGIQVLPDTPEQTFEGIDLLDPTKIVPEELAPVQPIGLLTLNRNTTNYFAETEQVAFHVGHLPPGIDVTDDPLLHARLFSYVDTQLSRLGGPNFNQIPINRPHAPVNDMLRDGFHQHAVHSGVAPYKPNSLDGGCPFHAGADSGAFAEVAATVAASVKQRRSPASFADHFSQARLFYLSLTAVERDHVIRAFTFELGKCYERAIKERQLRVLAAVDTELCAQVAAGLGLPVPEQAAPAPEVIPSPALSQVGKAWPTDGRVVGIVVDADDPDSLNALHTLRQDITSADMTPLVIAARGGELADGLIAQRTFLTTRSVEFDAILLAAAPPPAPDALPVLDAKAGVPAATVDPRVVLMLQEAYRHGKAIGTWGGEAALAEAGIAPTAPGVVVGDDPAEVFTQVTQLLTLHRVWERFATTAS